MEIRFSKIGTALASEAGLLPPYESTAKSNTVGPLIAVFEYRLRLYVKFLTGNLCMMCTGVSVGTGGSVGGHSVRQDPLCEEQGRAGR